MFLCLKSTFFFFFFWKRKSFYNFFYSTEKKHIKEKLFIFFEKRKFGKWKVFRSQARGFWYSKTRAKCTGRRGWEAQNFSTFLFPSKFIVRLLFSKLRASMKEVGLGAKKKIVKKRRQKSLMNFEGSSAVEWDTEQKEWKNFPITRIVFNGKIKGFLFFFFLEKTFFFCLLFSYS